MTSPILIVEDEPDLAATCERLLRRQGYEVVTAGSWEAAMAIMRRGPLALVISDLRLPDGDGLDIVRAARVAPTPTPSIVLTAFPSDSSRRAALAAGASAYLAKPFSVSTLSDLVRHIASSASHAS